MSQGEGSCGELAAGIQSTQAAQRLEIYDACGVRGDVYCLGFGFVGAFASAIHDRKRG